MNHPQHTLRTLKLETLRPYHQNPRRGDVAAIKDSLKANGQFQPLVVNQGTHTGRPWEILSGSHTWRALRELHHEQPDQWADTTTAYVLDVDDNHARRIMLAANRTADHSTYDHDTLLDLLGDMEDLAGTGWDEEDLQHLTDGQEYPEPQTEPDTSTSTGTPAHGDTYNGIYPYPGNRTITLSLMPPLWEQWAQHTQHFDSPEEALEYLLDHHT